MPAPKLESVRSRIETTIALARLLERVEHNPAGVGADQYRALVGQLKLALAEELPNEALASSELGVPSGCLMRSARRERAGRQRPTKQRDRARGLD